MKHLVLSSCLLILGGCLLKRPDVPPPRVVDPQLPSLEGEQADADAHAVRLLPVRARPHIGRVVLRRQIGDELTDDPQWRWSTEPAAYLGQALQAALAAEADLVQSDAIDAESWAVELLICEIDQRDEPRLRLAATLTITAPMPDGAIQVSTINVEQVITAPPPSGLSSAAAIGFATLAERIVELGDRR